MTALLDIVSVSEATDWSVRCGVQAKYRALRCHVRHLQPSTDLDEVTRVQNLINGAEIR